MEYDIGDKEYKVPPDCIRLLDIRPIAAKQMVLYRTPTVVREATATVLSLNADNTYEYVSA